MFFSHKTEDKQQITAQQIKTLSLQIEHLDQQMERLHEELQVTPDQLLSFIECPDNFSEESWHTLQSHKKQLDEKLTLDLETVHNPLKTKSKYAEQQVAQHWLFVR